MDHREQAEHQRQQRQGVERRIVESHGAAQLGKFQQHRGVVEFARRDLARHQAEIDRQRHQQMEQRQQSGRQGFPFLPSRLEQKRGLIGQNEQRIDGEGEEMREKDQARQRSEDGQRPNPLASDQPQREDPQRHSQAEAQIDEAEQERAVIDEQRGQYAEARDLSVQHAADRQRPPEQLRRRARQEQAHRAFDAGQAVEQKDESFHRQVGHQPPIGCVVLIGPRGAVAEEDVLAGDVIGQVVKRKIVEDKKRRHQQDGDEPEHGALIAEITPHVPPTRRSPAHGVPPPTPAMILSIKPT